MWQECQLAFKNIASAVSNYCTKQLVQVKPDACTCMYCVCMRVFVCLFFVLLK